MSPPGLLGDGYVTCHNLIVILFVIALLLQVILRRDSLLVSI